MLLLCNVKTNAKMVEHVLKTKVVSFAYALHCTQGLCVNEKAHVMLLSASMEERAQF